LVIIILVGPLFGDLFICCSKVSRRTFSPAACFMMPSPRGSASLNEDAGYGRGLRVLAVPNAFVTLFFLEFLRAAILSLPFHFEFVPTQEGSGRKRTGYSFHNQTAFEASRVPLTDEPRRSA
jgi:hypothetical protein